MQDTARFIRALEKRITTDATLTQVEEWWSLALEIGASFDRDAKASAQEREASRRLLWAVSSAIRAMKASGRADHQNVRAALAAVRRAIDRRTQPAEFASPGPDVSAEALHG